MESKIHYNNFKFKIINFNFYKYKKVQFGQQVSFNFKEQLKLQ